MNIYIGNLNPSITTDELREKFSYLGELGEITIVCGGSIQPCYAIITLITVSEIAAALPSTAA